MLHPMSNEQYNVYSHMKEGKNVIVDACAGSGKSTTILSIAKEMETKKSSNLRIIPCCVMKSEKRSKNSN